MADPDIGTLLRGKLRAAISETVADAARQMAGGNGNGHTAPMTEDQLDAPATVRDLMSLAGPIKACLRELVAEELAKRPAMKYEGVWDAQKVYRPGDCVTCSGVLWHANESSVGQHPGEGATAWKLMHKTKGAR